MAMSRDWTPCETYEADKFLTREGNSLRNDTLALITASGERIPLVNKDMMKEYPELCFLGQSVFGDIYEKCKGNKEVRNLLDAFEKALVKAEKLYEEDKYPDNRELWKLDDKDFFELPVETVMEEWFYGKLDPQFYYSEYNNKVLMSYVGNQIENLIKEEKRTKKNDVIEKD